MTPPPDYTFLQKKGHCFLQNQKNIATFAYAIQQGNCELCERAMSSNI